MNRRNWRNTISWLKCVSWRFGVGAGGRAKTIWLNEKQVVVQRIPNLSAQHSCTSPVLNQAESHRPRRAYLWHGELAGPWAVVRVKRLGWYNPFTPSNVSKIHFQVPSSTVPGLVPLFLACLFNRLLVKLQQRHLMPLVLACLFSRPSGLFVLKGFVRTWFIPAGRLVGILGSGKLIVLERQQDIDRALVPVLWLLLLSVIPLAQQRPVEAMRGGAFARHQLVSLEGGHHTLRLRNGRVVGVNQDVRQSVWKQRLPRVGPQWSHLDPDEQLVVVLGLTDHTGDVLPLPRDEVPVEGGHVDPEVSQSPCLVVHWGKAPDDHVDVAVPAGSMAPAPLGPRAALGAVLKVSDVVVKSSWQHVLRLSEGGEVENLESLAVDQTWDAQQKRSFVQFGRQISKLNVKS